jgi:hypothetical protein
MVQQRRQIAEAFGSAASPAPGRVSSPVAQRELSTYDDIKKSAKTGRFSWEPLRSSISGGDPEKKGVTHGLGAGLRDGKSELETRVTWSGTSENGDGQKMVAFPLGPDHKLGSEPVSGQQHVWNANRAKLKKITGETYVAGHLLNNNLGGPGNDSRNLAAIPATINSSHSKVAEEKVKKLVNGKGRFIKYEVEVEQGTFRYRNRDLSYASNITTRWCAVDKENKTLPPVREVSIPIPSPVPTKKSLDILDNRVKINKADGARALFDVKTHIVLSNEGYLRVARNVQQIFRESIDESEQALKKTQGELTAAQLRAKDLEVQLGELTQSKEKSEEKNQILQEELKYAQDDMEECEERLEGIAKQMDKTRRQLKETQDELIDKITQLQRSKEENTELAEENSVLSRNLESVLAELEETKGLNLALIRRNKELFERSNDLIAISDEMFGKYDRGTDTDLGRLLSPQRESEKSSRKRYDSIRQQHALEKQELPNSSEGVLLPNTKTGQ